MVNNYNTFNTIIGRVSIEPTLEHATSYGGILPLLDYVKKIQLPDYTTYYNDLQRFETTEDVQGLKETNGVLTKRVLSDQDRVILDFGSSVNTVYGNQEGAEVGYNATILERKACILFMFSKALVAYAYIQS